LETPITQHVRESVDLAQQCHGLVTALEARLFGTKDPTPEAGKAGRPDNPLLREAVDCGGLLRDLRTRIETVVNRI
jgi:hypothetical protein